MKLSRDDADLFFKLMWGLQFYVNQTRHILPEIKSPEEYAALPGSDKVQVRDALWEHPDLIDAYLAQNPDGLSAEEMELVCSWKRFVAGTFQVFRFLKKHTIFIDDESKVYGVLGLYDSLEDVFYGRRPPIMIEAVLLPFKGRIVYDGAFRGYNILFGGGIRSALNEDYMAAKQNGRIITTLEPEVAKPAQTGHPPKPGKDWGPLVEEIVAASEQMKGGPAIQSAALAVLRASARLAQATVRQPDDVDELWHHEQQVRRAVSRLQSVLDRAQR
jgi:hypothetical protein